MKFVLVDRIVELEAGRRIVATKSLSRAEEYLADHFPTFPVMPGVLMLEAMVQASAWLVRVTQDFAPSTIVLKEARNVTYKSFVAPGQVLTIEAICQQMSANESVLVATGKLEAREIVKGRLTLRHLNLSDGDPALAELDEQIRGHFRRELGLLTGGRPLAASLAG